MPRQSALALAFDRDEWELIVTLPRRVLIAAVAAAPVEGRRAAEGVAGIEAIASGLASSSSLVREVVASIYSESHEEPTDLFGEGEAVQTLAACRYASEVVGARSTAEDAAAYRDWLRHLAAVVTGVAQGVSGLGDEPAGRVGLAESRFLYALGGVLRA
jgi:hypothetical protein